MRVRPWICISTMSAASMLAVCTTSFAGGSNCCVPNGGVGCDDPTCQATVCAADSFCCNVAWDSICASEAASLCGNLCGGGGGSNCCVPNGGVGCDDPTCQGIVCAADSFCCNVAWDSICASEAASMCGDLCGGGGGNPACPSANDCCVPNGTPGCNDESCCNTVCAADSFCCAVAWDGICANEAFAMCGDLCGGGGSNCCFPNGGIGCDDPECSAFICAIDSFCCAVAWDSICAGEAASFCTVCGGTPPPPCDTSCPPGAQTELEPCGGDSNGGCNGVGGTEPMTAGVPVCGTFWADAGTRDTDWYDFSVPAPGHIMSLSVNASFPAAAALLGTNCPPTVYSFVTSNAPCPVTAEFCLAEGSYRAFVATNTFAGNPCGSGLNDYVATLTQGDDCEALSTCCYASGGLGCDDPDCTSTICSIDSFCCAVAWDSVCAGEAASFCKICGGTPPEPCDTSCPVGGEAELEPCGDDTNGGCNTVADSTCCFANGGVGCDDPDCQALVCAADSFCCAVAWDGICAGEAASLCGDLCSIAGFNYEAITSGVPKCGTFWADNNIRDTDWYEFSVVGDAQNVTLSVNANFPTALALLDKNCPPGIFVFTGFQFPCGASVTFCLNEGDYAAFVAPNAFAGNPCGSGFNDYVATLTIGPACQGITNDECEDASGISEGVTPFTTIGATTSPPPLDPSCERGFGLALVNDIWFTYTATKTGTVTVSLCDGTDYDSRIAAYTSCDGDIVACNDDFCGLVSEMSFDTVCDTKYLLRIGGFGGSGSGNITITQTGKDCVSCTGDLNGDGVVDASDLAILLGGWGFPGTSDLNGDGTTDAQDLAILLGAWGTCPP